MRRASVRKSLAMVVAFIVLFTAIALTPVQQVSATGTIYYVDAVNGNDANNGTSTGTAWQSLSKVNGMTFSAGDKILFKAGCSWTGSLSPKGSGASGSPIIIDMYGTGNKPAINGSGTVTNVFTLTNQEYWEVKNLEITNDNDFAVDQNTAERTAVRITLTDFGTANHIYLQDIYIHDIDGTQTTKGNGGIFFNITGTVTPSKFNDVIVEGCTLRKVDRSGMRIYDSTWSTRGSNWLPSTNTIIRNNFLDDIGGDGIVARVSSSIRVEYNAVKDSHIRDTSANVAIWAFNADDSIIQYNECYLTHTTNDGQGFDCDYGCNRTIMQYNYSHDNEGGFMLICCNGTSYYNDGSIIRYNISQNDKTRIFQFAGPTSNTSIYNNTIYIKSGLSTKVYDHGDWGGYAKNTYSYNNIFYNLGSGGYSFGSSTNNVFDYNCYYGNHNSGEPSDVHKYTSNPSLVSSGTAGTGYAKVINGGTGVNTSVLDGYKLNPGSPCIGVGKVITDNGGKDLWGNVVSSTTTPNIGAYNGAAPVENNLVSNPGFESGSLSPWTLWNDTSVVNTNVRSGSYAVRVGAGPASAEQVITVQPNTTYTLSGYALSTAGDRVSIGVKNYGGVQQSADITSTSYQQGTVTFKTGAANTTATIYVYHPSGTGNCYADDISVIAGGTMTYDAFVQDGSYANTNYGTNPSLLVKSDAAGYRRKAYLKFNTSYFGGSSASSAKLRLYVASTGTDASKTIKVYGTSEEGWTETGITWNNAPAGTTYLGSLNISNTAGVWYELDVTGYANSHMTDRVVSFLLVNEGAISSNGLVEFSSREAAANQPLLVIQ